MSSGSHPPDVTHRSGLAVTTVPRTLADVAAASLAEEFVAQAVQQALARGLALPEEILAAGRTRRVRPAARAGKRGGRISYNSGTMPSRTRPGTGAVCGQCAFPQLAC